MSREHKLKRKKRGRSRKESPTPFTTSWLLGGGLAVICVLGGLWLLFGRGGGQPPDAAAEQRGIAPETGQANAEGAEPSEAIAPELAEAELDRALRAEQLEVGRQVLEDFPESDDAVYFVGLVHNEQGDSATAIELWERSLEMNASRADAHESLGYEWFLRDEFEKAESHLRKAVALDSSAHRARYRLGLALQHQAKWDEVVAVLDVGKEISPETHRLLGEAYQRLNQLDKAAEQFRHALAGNPDLTQAHYGLARILTRRGEIEEAGVHLEKFTALTEREDGEGREKRRAFDPLEITSQSLAVTRTDAGRLYLFHGMAGAAERHWLRAEELDPENLLCRLQLAVFYQETKRPKESLRYFQEVARLDPADGRTQLHIGNLRLQLNELDRAEEAFKKLIELEPDRPEGFAALARLYLRLNKIPEALQLANRAAAIAPEAPQFALLSQAFARNGDSAGALAAIERAIALEPSDQNYQRLHKMLLENN